MLFLNMIYDIDLVLWAEINTNLSVSTLACIYSFISDSAFEIPLALSTVLKYFA